MGSDEDEVWWRIHRRASRLVGGGGCVTEPEGGGTGEGREDKAPKK